MTFHVRVWKESVHKWHLWQIVFQVLVLINAIGIQTACSLAAFDRLSFGLIKKKDNFSIIDSAKRLWNLAIIYVLIQILVVYSYT